LPRSGKYFERSALFRTKAVEFSRQVRQ